jgi:hypothetical protein
MQVKRSVKVDGRTIGTVAVEILDTLPAPAATINYRITSVVGGVIGCIRCTGYETMRRLVAARRRARSSLPPATATTCFPGSSISSRTRSMTS